MTRLYDKMFVLFKNPYPVLWPGCGDPSWVRGRGKWSLSHPSWYRLGSPHQAASFAWRSRPLTMPHSLGNLHKWRSTSTNDVDAGTPVRSMRGGSNVVTPVWTWRGSQHQHLTLLTSFKQNTNPCLRQCIVLTRRPIDNASFIGQPIYIYIYIYIYISTSMNDVDAGTPARSMGGGSDVVAPFWTWRGSQHQHLSTLFLTSFQSTNPGKCIVLTRRPISVNAVKASVTAT